ncbi:hypothetical protein E4U09_002536 [Claviceps aff. purpurea]|uniref:Mitochondrial outer membrane protein OM14 C-terminal domain-containing protein n=1 Tax=Claviceps aff. purpurea TaxID=1967640 RepID=A0A9P7QI12_9HYPO|nr:hypothetical protein E4U09_002536 [Claviceps aff. purpurea]
MNWAKPITWRLAPTAVSLFNPHLLLTSQTHSNNQAEALLRRKQIESEIIRSFLTQTSSSFESTLTLPRDVVSYADVAASGPKQTPEEAAAPQPVELVNTESVATASLTDVDIPSVHTVPSDFSEQPIQTETQANRLDIEAEADAEAEAEAAKTKAKAKVQNAKKQTAKKARETDSWLVQQFSGLSDGSASALAVTNLAAIIGVSSYLGYKAWGLYERGNLSWKTAGVGVGILAGVGAAEAVLGRYLYKGKKGSC